MKIKTTKNKKEIKSLLPECAKVFDDFRMRIEDEPRYIKSKFKIRIFDLIARLNSK